MTISKPTLEEAVKLRIYQTLIRLYTMMPGVVVTYDSLNQTADIQPAIDIVQLDTRVNQQIISKRPMLQSVPVLFPFGGGSTISWDLSPGDPVMIHWGMRSHDTWEEDRQPNPPNNYRRFDYNDPVAYPFGYTGNTSDIPANGNDIKISGNSITITGTTKVVVESSNVTLGGEPANFKAAIAEIVNSNLSDIKTWANTHTHTGVTTGPGTTGTATPLVGGSSDTASSIVKVKG